VSYYIRVLSTSDRAIAFSSLAGSVPSARLTVEAGAGDGWDQLLLTHANGREIAVIERNAVHEGSLGAEELEEFVSELSDAKPTSGSNWLCEYLPRVKVIYALQILGGSDEPDGWELIGAIKSKLWNEGGGILQADGEGFSNEDGYHVVWQFSDRAAGPWWMGLLKDGRWVHFQMELSNPVQRAAFLRGDVPDGVEQQE
jgi:hypothetical protein